MSGRDRRGEPSLNEGGERARLRTFYAMILTQTVSLIGSRISGIAVGIAIFNKTGSATPLTLVAFYFTLPQVALQGFAGLLADRWNRRNVMALADAGQALGTVLLFGLFSYGTFQVWHLYVITLVQSIFGSFQGPALNASVTLLVPEAQRDRANAVTQMSQPTAGIVAPAIAGIVYAAIGVKGAIAIDLGTFLIAVLVILSVQIPRPARSEDGQRLSGTFLREFAAGFRYLWARHALWLLVVITMVLSFVLNVSSVLMTPYLLARTGSEAVYGVILSMFNAGMLAGAIAIGIWGGTRPRMNTVIPSFLVTCTMVCIFGVARSPWLLAASAFLIMLPNTFATILLQSMLQAKVAPDVQGRVFGCVQQLVMLMNPVAYLIAGPLADRIFEPMVGRAGWETISPLVGNVAGSGMGLIFVLSGALGLVLSVVLFSVPMIRHIENILPDYEAQPARGRGWPETTGPIGAGE